MKHGLKQCFDLEPFNAHEWVYGPYEEARKSAGKQNLTATFLAIVESCFALDRGKQA
jgi:hypothetical protein